MTFVERDPAALAAVRANLASVGLADAERDGDATVVRADAEPWVDDHGVPLRPGPVDPPYGFEAWDDAGGARCPPTWPSSNRGPRSPPPEGWGVIKSKRYGGTIVTVARPELVTEIRPEMAAEKGAS